MRIRKIWIRGHNHFRDTFIDFTNPTTGEAVDKVCFIGKNGTGKSTLLRLIRDTLQWMSSKTPDSKQADTQNYDIQSKYFFATELSIGDNIIVYCTKLTLEPDGVLWGRYYFKESILSNLDWVNELATIERQSSTFILEKYSSHVLKNNEQEIFKFRNNSSDLLIYSPPEDRNNMGDPQTSGNEPKSDVDSALKLFSNFSFYHKVSSESVNEFWTVLIYILKKRQEEKEQFETSEENINKTKKELIREFDLKHPKILHKLAEEWDRILGKAGMFFDAEGANNPVQLKDNLHAYIYTLEPKQRIWYNQLSTGIRNFIFRIGHIYSLYFNREIKKGIVLIDEPENSLFPDFLYDLIETYQRVFVDKNGENNTQFFVATHSPIIAAQFEPYERIILEWDEPGSVKAEKGKAPAGDDPNDILKQDFSIAHLMGKKGEEMWKEYLDMKKRLRATTDENEKSRLVEKITHLGAEYNF